VSSDSPRSSAIQKQHGCAHHVGGRSGGEEASLGAHRRAPPRRRDLDRIMCVCERESSTSSDREPLRRRRFETVARKSLLLPREGREGCTGRGSSCDLRGAQSR
jgi:hypothetical protein